MTDLEPVAPAQPVMPAWEYAPAPESKDIVRLEDRYGLFIGERCDPAVGLVGDLEREPGHRSGLEREQEPLRGVVDPVDRRVVVGRWGQAALDHVDDDQRVLIPEREVSEDRGGRPSGGHRRP